MLGPGGGARLARVTIMKQTSIDRCAGDLMARDVVTVSPETPILDVHRLFVEEEIHGAPVVDEDGVVRGVISTLDLLRIVRDEAEPDTASTDTRTSGASRPPTIQNGATCPRASRRACNTSRPAMR